MTNNISELGGLIIRAEFQEYQPVFVNAEKFDALWRNSGSPLFVKEWTGEAGRWFFSVSGKRAGFYVARVNLGYENKSVTFLGGRRRTRWLLQHNTKKVPIGLTMEGFEVAEKLGLDPEYVMEDETFLNS